MLSINVFPKNILHLISEYSKPVTRPDWRTIKILTQYRIFLDISHNVYKKRIFYKIYS